MKFIETSSYGPSERNEVIDAKDAVFGRLLLCATGTTTTFQPEELQSVAEAGVVAFGTDYKNRKRVDKHGNEFRQRGTSRIPFLLRFEMTLPSVDALGRWRERGRMQRGVKGYLTASSE